MPGELVPPDVFSNRDGSALKLVNQRARADFVARINLLARIADGDIEQQVTTTGPDGRKTVTTYTPSAKDRMAALTKLAEYGHVPVPSKGQGGGGTDLPTLIRALASVMADPVTRRNLMQDPKIAGTLTLLAAEPVELVDDGTAAGVPGEGDASDDDATA